MIAEMFGLDKVENEMDRLRHASRPTRVESALRLAWQGRLHDIAMESAPAQATIIVALPDCTVIAAAGEILDQSPRYHTFSSLIKGVPANDLRAFCGRVTSGKECIQTLRAESGRLYIIRANAVSHYETAEPDFAVIHIVDVGKMETYINANRK